MHVLIITDAYFPKRTSVAVLLYELAQTFLEDHVEVSIIVPSPTQLEPLIFEEQEGCSIIYVKALQTKDVNYVHRTFSEFINPWLIWRTLKRSTQFTTLPIDGVIWYSPSIFWGPLIKRLKNHFACKSYLILRDIFPDWALHLGVIKKGLPYLFLKAVEHFQYQQADTIGIQSPNNVVYFKRQQPVISAKLEVLWNWARPLNAITKTTCSINVSQTAIGGRVIFVYAGNIGVAQGIYGLLHLIENLKDNSEIGFMVVGRGSEVAHMREVIAQKNLNNVVVLDEISPFEIPSLFEQCDVGLLFLDQRHQTHNIPGKFVAYLQSGLPVLAAVNPGNDLITLIPDYKIGEVYSGDNLAGLSQKALALAKQVRADKNEISKRSQALAHSLFESKPISQQILAALRHD
jgi:glycosyltransferase involved in cell wall biosynthesis